jgi:O-antigen/teichoic acid export membrane protein
LLRDNSTRTLGPARKGARPRALTRLAGQQSLVSLASFIVSLAALSAFIPILVRVLGAKEYGAWVLTGGIVNYIGLFDFGMSLTIARFVALSYEKDRREAEEAIGAGLGVVTLLGSVMFAAAFLFASRWEQYLGVPGSAFALRLAGCALPVLLLSKVLQSALEGAGQVGLSRVIQTVGTVCFVAAGTSAVLLSSEKLQALSLVLLANSLVVLGAYWSFLMREWGWKFPLALPRRSTFRRVVTYAFAIQGSSIVGSSVDPLSRYLLVTAAGPAAVTPLDIALRAATTWLGAALAFTRPILPGLGRLAGADDAVEQRAELLWKRVLEVGVTTGSYLALLVYLVFPILFGNVGIFGGKLGAVAVLLWTPSVIAIVPYVYVVLYGRARDVFAIQLVTSGVGVALMLALIWSLGAWAPVIGIGTGSIVGSLLAVRIARRRARRRTSFGLSGLPARVLAYPLVAAMIVVLPAPVAIRVAVATILWTLINVQPIRGLLRLI